MKKKVYRIPTQDETGVLIAFLALLIGCWVWISIPARAGFPINDGGLFYKMIRAIQGNGYHLPDYVQYNGLAIPFSYPPLGFITAAILCGLLHVDPIEILRWLPAIVSTTAIPAFFRLARVILNSSFKAGVATFFFALTPRVMDWRIMGGGLTRSFGLIFLLLTLGSVYQLFVKRENKYLPQTILFSTLTVLSHPEAAIHTIGFCLLFWFFHGRNKTGTIHAFLIGLGTAVLTAPWWIHLLATFGLSPIQAAAQTGSHAVIAIFLPMILLLTDEPMITFIAVLGMLGFVIHLSRKDYLLPIAYLLPFIVEPRSAPVYFVIPLTMLAGWTISDVILPTLASKTEQTTFQNHTVVIFLAFFGLYLTGSALLFGSQFIGNTVSAANREAFEWIKSNTPEQSRFLVLTGESDVFCDGISEWFPALTDRISLTTIQGREWLDGKFAAASATQVSMQNCLSESDSLGCINSKTKQTAIQYEYLYIARQSTIKQLCRVIANTTRGDKLISQLNQQSNYTPVYQTDDVLIFMLRNK